MPLAPSLPSNSIRSLPWLRDERFAYSSGRGAEYYIVPPNPLPSAPASCASLSPAPSPCHCLGPMLEGRHKRIARTRGTRLSFSSSWRCVVGWDQHRIRGQTCRTNHGVRSVEAPEQYGGERRERKGKEPFRQRGALLQALLDPSGRGGDLDEVERAAVQGFDLLGLESYNCRTCPLAGRRPPMERALIYRASWILLDGGVQARRF